jgi:hypothetical protein
LLSLLLLLLLLVVVVVVVVVVEVMENLVAPQAVRGDKLEGLFFLQTQTTLPLEGHLPV